MIKTRKVKTDKGSKGGILLEFTIILPVLMLLFALVINVTTYLLNLWIIHAVVLPQGLSMAAKGDDINDIENVTEGLLRQQLTSTVSNIDVTPTADVTNKTITLETTADFDLVFKFKPIVSSLNIKAEAIGATP